MFIKVECPYCYNINSVSVNGVHSYKTLVTCDIYDSDGCDSEFVVNINTKYATTVYSLVEKVKEVPKD